MTSQERQLLESLTTRIAGTSVSPKDPEADALIRQKLGSLPDALYILTQTVLIQEMALNQANDRLHQLQQQIDSHQGQENAAPTSFLGRLFGTGASSRPLPSQSQPPSYAPPPPAYASQYDPPQYAAPQYAASNQGSSFLRSAAMTATGVAAGALAFEGIESLFGHHSGFGGNSFSGGDFLGGGGQSETIVNNYYDEPGAGGGRDQFTTSDNNDNQPDYSGTDVSDPTFDDSSDQSGDDFSSTDV